MISSPTIPQPGSGRHPVSFNDSAVRAYHQNLSLHLVSLIRATSPHPALNPERCALPQPTSTSMRQQSGSSSSSTKLSSVSSNEESRRASMTSPATTIEEEKEDALSSLPDSSAIPMPVDSTAVPDVKLDVPIIALSREAEHKKAWETDGCRVWQAISETFELKLETTKSRRSSNGSDDSPRPQVVGLGLKGSNQGDMAMKMGLVAEVETPRSKTGNRTAYIGPSRSEAHSSSVTASASAVVSPILASSSSLALKASMSTPKAKGSSDVKSDCYEDEEYDMKREMRTRRKEAELRAKVGSWLDGVELDIEIARETYSNIPARIFNTTTIFRLPPLSNHPTPSAFTRFQPFPLASDTDLLLPLSLGHTNPPQRIKSLPKPLGDLEVLEALLGESIPRSISPNIEIKDGMPTPKAKSAQRMGYCK